MRLKVQAFDFPSGRSGALEGFDLLAAGQVQLGPSGFSELPQI